MPQSPRVEPPSGPRRVFNLGDALILMAAAAMGLLVLRGDDWFLRLARRSEFWRRAALELTGLSAWSFTVPREWVVESLGRSLAEEAAHLVIVMVLALAPAVLWMRLRRPCPRGTALVRGPGFAIPLGLVVGAVGWFLFEWLSDSDPWAPLVPLSGVAALWAMLPVPPWKLEATWIDRLGRVLGMGWIAGIWLWSVKYWIA